MPSFSHYGGVRYCAGESLSRAARMAQASRIHSARGALPLDASISASWELGNFTNTAMVSSPGWSLVPGPLPAIRWPCFRVVCSCP